MSADSPRRLARSRSQELRELARGIHPAVLTDRGPRGRARRAGRARARARRRSRRPGDRLPPPIESAAYFVVAEALTNVAKLRPGQRGAPSSVRAPQRSGSSSRSPTTASAAPSPAAARACGARRSRRGARRRARPGQPAGARHHARAEIPCGSSSPRTPCCCARASRGCSRRPGSRSSGRPATATSCSRRSSAPAGRRDRRHPHAADPHRRGPAGRAGDPRASCPGVGVLVLSQYVEEALRRRAAGRRRRRRRLPAQGPRRRRGRVRRRGAPGRRRRLGARPRGRLAAARRARRDDDPLDGADPREREVLALMAEGRSNQAIADALVVTERAVEKHVTSIFAKLAAAGHDRRSPPAVLAVLAFLRLVGITAPADTSRPHRRGTGTASCSPHEVQALHRCSRRRNARSRSRRLGSRRGALGNPRPRLVVVAP